MKRKIDQNSPPLRKRFSMRAALGTALLCLLTSLYSYGQSTTYTNLMSTQEQLAEYTSNLLEVDVSTPEGAELKQQLLDKIDMLTELAGRLYGELNMQEQMDFQANFAGGSKTFGNVAPSPELMARMDGLGIPYSNPGAIVTGTSGSSSTSTGTPASGPVITVP